MLTRGAVLKEDFTTTDFFEVLDRAKGTLEQLDLRVLDQRQPMGALWGESGELSFLGQFIHRFGNLKKLVVRTICIDPYFHRFELEQRLNTRHAFNLQGPITRTRRNSI